MPLLILLAKFPVSPKEGLSLAFICSEPCVKHCCLLSKVRPTWGVWRRCPLENEEPAFCQNIHLFVSCTPDTPGWAHRPEPVPSQGTSCEFIWSLHRPCEAGERQVWCRWLCSHGIWVSGWRPSRCRWKQLEEQSSWHALAGGHPGLSCEVTSSPS